MRVNVLVALLIGALFVPFQASAESGYSSTRVHLRAGPGTSYPILGVIPASAPVDIHGCISSYSWCDVSWGMSRGWVAARYLRTGRTGRSVFLRHGPPVTAFDFNNYWTSHYRNRSFYRDRGLWSFRDRQPGFGGGSQTQVHPGRQSSVRPGHQSSLGNPGSTFGPAPTRPPCDPATQDCPRFR